jgi:hypothetical protein
MDIMQFIWQRMKVILMYVVRMLVEFCADINTVLLNNGETLIHIAVSKSCKCD